MSIKVASTSVMSPEFTRISVCSQTQHYPQFEGGVYLCSALKVGLYILTELLLLCVAIAVPKPRGSPEPLWGCTLSKLESISACSLLNKQLSGGTEALDVKEQFAFLFFF